MSVGNKEKRREEPAKVDLSKTKVKWNLTPLSSVTAGSRGSKVTFSETVLSLDFNVDMSGRSTSALPWNRRDVLEGPVVIFNLTHANADVKYQNKDLRLAE